MDTVNQPIIELEERDLGYLDSLFRPLDPGEVDGEAMDRWCQDKRPLEKILETLLALEFEKLTGVEVVCTRASRALCSEADVVALDRLGRVHMVEVKVPPLTSDDVEQVEQYMLRQVFVDRSRYFGDWKLEGDRLALIATTLAGVVWGSDQTKVGHSLCKSQYTRDPELRGVVDRIYQGVPGETKYRELRYSDGRLHVAMLLSRAQESGRRLPGTLEDAVEAIYKAAQERLASPYLAEPDFDRVPIPRRPLVLWAVAPEVRPEALERLSELRAAGVDARALEIDLNRCLDDGDSLGWKLKVRRETAPIRDRNEKRAAALVHQWSKDQVATADDDELRLQTSFYEERAASARGGTPLAGRLSDFQEIEVFLGQRKEKIGPNHGDWLALSSERLDCGREELRRTLHSWAERTELVDWPGFFSNHSWPQTQLAPTRRPSNERDGRIGVDLCGDERRWFPGLFAGVMIGGFDHHLGALDHSGCDVVCMVDISHQLFSKWGSSNKQRLTALTAGGAFASFTAAGEALNRTLLHSAWQVHLATDQIAPNLWHPLALRRPLAKVIGDLTDAEGAYDRFLEAVQEGLSILCDTPEVEAFVADIRVASHQSPVGEPPG